MRSMQAFWPRIVLALVLTLSSENVLAQDPMWENWGKPLADKLKRFLPGPVSGLIDRMPWDPEWESPPSGFACSNEGCQQFLPVFVSTEWRMADPVLVQQVEAAEKQVEAEMAAHLKQRQAMAERMEELNRQGKLQELEKLVESLDAKGRELERRVPDLQGRARRLEQSVGTNQTLQDHRAGPEAKQIGTLKGYPLYRFAASDEPYGATSEWVVLLVYLGPAGFKNPIVPYEKVRTELKCIVVGAEIRSTPRAVKADEALAKQMLEKVDYAGLAKLIQP